MVACTQFSSTDTHDTDGLSTDLQRNRLEERVSEAHRVLSLKENSHFLSGVRAFSGYRELNLHFVIEEMDTKESSCWKNN